MNVGYMTFGRDELCYGLEQVLRPLRSKHDVRPVDWRTMAWADVVYVSVFWWEHVWAYHDVLLRANWRVGQRPRVVVGGFNTANPWVFHNWADAIHVGDGEECAERLLTDRCEHCFDGGPILWHNARLAPILHVTNGIGRIEIARGCKYACRFCQVSWQKAYREADKDAVLGLIRQAARSGISRVALFAPEPHTAKNEAVYNIECKARGLHRLDSDTRWDNVGPERSAPPRIGVEGISERLRASVRKPISDEQIIDIVARHSRSGGRRVFMYLILDLPGEGPEDYEAFGDLLRKIDEIPGLSDADFSLCPTPNTFMPAPHTPLAWERIHADIDYRQVWGAMFRRGSGQRPWKVKIAERTRIYRPQARILSMIATRGGAESPDLMRRLLRDRLVEVSDGRITRIDSRIYTEVDHGRYCGTYEKGQGPWEIVRTRRLWSAESRDGGSGDHGTPVGDGP